MNYKLSEFDKVKIYSQETVSDNEINLFNEYFKIAYKVVESDLGIPEIKPKIYIYQSDVDLFNELIDVWKYSGWLKAYKTIPRMNKNFEMWAFPGKDIKFIAHEYSHRIIEQIAGLNSQVNYKWFDEGLAEFEGIRALQEFDRNKALEIKKKYLKSVLNFYKNKSLTKINSMSTEDQWTNGIKEYKNKNYLISFVMMNYLIDEFGIEKVKQVLYAVNKMRIFLVAFKKVYGITVEDFEKKFISYLNKL